MSAGTVFVRALVGGAVLAVAAAVIGGVLGYLVAGEPGLWGALAGAVLAAVFLGLTTASMLVARRVTRHDPTSPVFFLIVSVAWLLKLVLFVVLMILLRGQNAIDPAVFGITAVVVAAHSLVVDVIALARTRVPIDVELPSAPEAPAAKD
jgi:hypothetical protein